MNFEELLAKYQALLLENTNLKEQIELLKAASITSDSQRKEGSINLLSYGSAEESIMRLDSSNIANELLRTIAKQ